MGTDPPFKEGDPVRLKPEYRTGRKCSRGVVKHCFTSVRPGLWWVNVRYQVNGRQHVVREAPSQLELDPNYGEAVDETCKKLARAVLEDGDMVAALALADRVIELMR